MVWSSTDVTDYRQRARTYEQVFDEVDDVISVHDPDAERMVDVNGTMTDLTGYDRNTLHELGVEGVTASTRQDAVVSALRTDQAAD
ncbi:hypothetical protein BRC64_03720 [Halobacteriales archaeon QH_10_67_22]|nr:MAG: hypothetical protein BRC64_03720 [Halobacteriales archaeon QH_10_67_22]